MKIDKKSPRHWLYLLLMGANAIVAIVLRPILYRNRQPVKHVVLYGHKLNGNLLALYRHVKASNPANLRVIFLTLDPHYYWQLREQGESCELATGLTCLVLLLKTDALITDHGLHSLLPLLFFSSIKFIDVWHGIPFKGFDEKDFRVQHRYDEVWVASPLMKQLYVERFGFKVSQVKVTGYARTDRLVNNTEDPVGIKQRLGLNEHQFRKVVLVAPTWKQGSASRSLYPFGLSEQGFLGALSRLGETANVTFILRTHLNSAGAAPQDYAHIVYLPADQYPDTEEILLISDILVCDWSSIAFDYLLLERPTIFLDVEPPFAKGLSLGGEYRFGRMANSLSVLQARLQQLLCGSEAYPQSVKDTADVIRREIYSQYADGQAAIRYTTRLQMLLQPQSGF